MTRFIVAISVAVLAVGLPHPAQGQSVGSRVVISVNGGTQPTSTAFKGTAARPVYLETQTTTATYDIASGSLFDGGVDVRVVKGLGVGVALSSFSKSGDVPISATVPHPFFYNTPRNFTAIRPGLKRKELAVHIAAVYRIKPARRLSLAVGVGPSFFNGKQDLLSDANFGEAYPYDTASYVDALVLQSSKSGIGFNAGVDLSVDVARHVGIGLLVRRSHASLDFEQPNGTVLKADVGGLQVGGGLRLFF
jgi:hypothetical protein